MKKIWKKLVSLILAASMLGALLPVTALASETSFDETEHFVNVNEYFTEFEEYIEESLVYDVTPWEEPQDEMQTFSNLLRSGAEEARWQTAADAEWTTGSFTEAVEGVYDSGTIELLQNVYLTATFEFNKNMTITSADEEKTKMLTCAVNGHGYLLNITKGTLTLENVAVDGGYDETAETKIYSRRGLIAVNGGSLVLNDGTEIRNNYNTTINGAGGGVCVISGTANMNGGVIKNNSAYSGGGVAVLDGSFELNDSGKIEKNKAETYGGGIYLSGGSFTANDIAEINDNKAKYGGGIYINFNTAAYLNDNCLISGNYAEKYGGGIYQYHTAMYKDGNLAGTSKLEIIGNISDENFKGVQIVDNKAYMCAGGYIASVPGDTLNKAGISERGVTRLKNVTIENNEAEYKSGGLLTAPGINIYISGVINISSNDVTSDTPDASHAYDNFGYHLNLLFDNDYAPDNTYTAGYAIIEGPLDTDSVIYIDTCQKTYPYVPGSKFKEIKQLVVKPADNYVITEDDFKCFSSDDETFLTLHDKTDGNIYLIPAAECIVSFHSMGGVPEDIPNAEIFIGDKVPEPSPEPTKTGYNFVGWYRSDDNGKTLYDTEFDFDKPITEVEAGEWTLYAKWELLPGYIEYIVKYDLAGGEDIDNVGYDDEKVLAGTNVTVKEEPQKIGYSFVGFESEGIIYQPEETILVNKDITLTACWKEIETEDSDDGKDDEPITPDRPSRPSYGKVTLTKVDAEDNDTVLSGVEFALYKENGRLVDVYTTDADGEITVEKLRPGDYYWVELSPAAGYELDDTEHEFSVRKNRHTEMTVENIRSFVPEYFTNDHYAYVVGYDDGMVHPEWNITRAEVAAIFFRLLNQETRDAYLSEDNNFSDVKKGDWFNTSVSTMAAMGIISGYPDGKFYPLANITRAEFAAITARFEENGNATDGNFADIYGHWAIKEINIAANNGWVLGYEDGSFRPDQKITRAEAMAMVNRVLQRVPQYYSDLLPQMKIWPDNTNIVDWYYLAVQEATNSHDYKRKTNGYEYWTMIIEASNWNEYL